MLKLLIPPSTNEPRVAHPVQPLDGNLLEWKMLDSRLFVFFFDNFQDLLSAEIKKSNYTRQKNDRTEADNLTEKKGSLGCTHSSWVFTSS